MSNRSKWWNLSENLILIKCWYFIAKVWINQNVGIWLKNKELIRILKLRTKLYGNQSKWSNLSANHQIIQNVVFWVKSGESIKKLMLECNKVGIDQNVEIWVQNIKSIKMLKFEQKRWRLIKCWYSIAKVEIDQIIGIWLKNKGIDQNIEIWGQH